SSNERTASPTVSNWELRPRRERFAEGASVQRRLWREPTTRRERRTRADDLDLGSRGVIVPPRVAGSARGPRPDVALSRPGPLMPAYLTQGRGASRFLGQSFRRLLVDPVPHSRGMVMDRGTFTRPSRSCALVAFA